MGTLRSMMVIPSIYLPWLYIGVHIIGVTEVKAMSGSSFGIHDYSLDNLFNDAFRTDHTEQKFGQLVQVEALDTLMFLLQDKGNTTRDKRQVPQCGTCTQGQPCPWNCPYRPPPPPMPQCPLCPPGHPGRPGFPGRPGQNYMSPATQCGNITNLVNVITDQTKPTQPPLPPLCNVNINTLVRRAEDLIQKLKVLQKVDARIRVVSNLLGQLKLKIKDDGGPKGPKGDTGHKGARGPAGLRGSRGRCTFNDDDDPSAGPPGEPGPKGERGPPGDKMCRCIGDHGEVGAAGGRGIAIQGDKGSRGEKGDRGVNTHLSSFQNTDE